MNQKLFLIPRSPFPISDLGDGYTLTPKLSSFLLSFVCFFCFRFSLSLASSRSVLSSSRLLYPLEKSRDRVKQTRDRLPTPLSRLISSAASLDLASSSPRGARQPQTLPLPFPCEPVRVGFCFSFGPSPLEILTGTCEGAFFSTHSLPPCSPSAGKRKRRRRPLEDELRMLLPKKPAPGNTHTACGF